jgi:hypothetical protein
MGIIQYGEAVQDADLVEDRAFSKDLWKSGLNVSSALVDQYNESCSSL